MSQGEKSRGSNNMGMKKSNKSKIVGLVVGGIAFVLSYYLVQSFFFPSSVDQVLTKVASEINKTCPYMIDNDTRLDRTVALPEKIFQYHYTLLNMDEQTISIPELKEYLEENIKNSVRTIPEMKYQRDNECTIEYLYNDKNKNFLFKVSVTPDQYK